MPDRNGIGARRVGLNLLFVEPGATGGMEIYARRLAAALALTRPEAELVGFVSREAGADGFPAAMELVRLPVSAASRVRRVVAEQSLLPLAARRADVEVLHSLASTGPLAGRTARVLTIHDLIYRTQPEAHARVLGLGLRILVPAAARRAQRILAVSDTTRAEVIELLGIPADRVDTVPNGPGMAPGPTVPGPEVRARLGLGAGPLVLSVGAKRAHKNLLRLIEAFARIETLPTPELVLPGYPTGHERELRDRAATLGVADRVRFLDWIADEDLEGLYREASLLAVPSLAEGFGLPVLEAMRRGLPVACSRGTALAEVAGDAGLLFDPRSVDEIVRSLTLLLGDQGLREKLARRGVERARNFSWEAAAEATWQAYDRVLSGRARSSPKARRTDARRRDRARR